MKLINTFMGWPIFRKIGYFELKYSFFLRESVCARFESFEENQKIQSVLNFSLPF